MPAITVNDILIIAIFLLVFGAIEYIWKRYKSDRVKEPIIANLEDIQHWFDKYLVDVSKPYAGAEEAAKTITFLLNLIRDNHLSLENKNPKKNIQISNGSDGSIQVSHVKAGGSVQVMNNSKDSKQVITGGPSSAKMTMIGGEGNSQSVE